MPASNPKEAKLDIDADKSINDSSASKFESALEDVDKCQTELDSLNEKASEEILGVEQKYNKLRRPHYEKRNEYVSTIPDFWYNVFINHPQIASILTNGEEHDVLRVLKSVNVEEFEDIKSGYKITFTFGDNKFFSNKELVKEFKLNTSGIQESKSTPVDWKEGRDLTKSAPQLMKGRKRMLGTYSSFFSWFVNNGDPTLDEIAETIKDDIWVNPLTYYLSPDVDVSAENGLSSEEDEEDLDESVVVIGDEDSEDDDEDDDEEGEDPEIFEVGDDDDDDEDDDDEDNVEEVEGDDED